MSNKSKSTAPTGPILYSADCGNGRVKGVSTESKGLIQFEPVVAPLTAKKDVPGAADKPEFSLRFDGRVLVAGLDDVFQFGKRDAIRRLNSLERYTHADYYNLLDIMFLHLFAAHRGNSAHISPVGVISLPISQYNQTERVQEIKSMICGVRVLTDVDGCELRLCIEDKNLMVVPESYGAIMHYAYTDDRKRRADTSTSGTTLVLDIGYETTDVSLFEGLRYKPDASFTIPRAGMGNVARAVADVVGQSVRGVDVSRVDRGMMAVAGMGTGSPKRIEVAPGAWCDISVVYEGELTNLAERISQGVLTNYTGSTSRVLLAGGGAYHLKDLLVDHFAATVEAVPDPDAANVLGAFTMLQIKAGL